LKPSDDSAFLRGLWNGC